MNRGMNAEGAQVAFSDSTPIGNLENLVQIKRQHSERAPDMPEMGS